MEVAEIDKRLIANLASVKENRNFIKCVYMGLKTDKEKREMIDYIASARRQNIVLNMSDVYLKELEIKKGREHGER